MDKGKKWIGYWLLLGVVMLMIQVLLGGITRLTGSGLSMTKWEPILGFIPPMTEVAWMKAFNQYKEIGQFKYLNQDFSLNDFKFIFFWEWLHRFWARFIAIAFGLPFIYFLYKRYVNWALAKMLLGLFVLGAGQGLIGWIMVASGLNDDNLYVNHIKLAAHFVSAMVLIAATFWFALSQLIPNEQRIDHSPLKKLSWFILSVLILQLVYGAFMAGLKAGSVAATWPSINGDYFPATLMDKSMVSNTVNIHFIHRMLAYTLGGLMILWYFRAAQLSQSALWRKVRVYPMVLVVVQILLGIFTVLSSDKTTRNGFGTFEYLAQAHQLVAMLLAMSMVLAIFTLGKKNQTTA